MKRDVKIKVREVEAGSCGPILASFLQGRPPADSLFPPPHEADGDRALKFIYSADSRRPGRGQLTGSSEIIEYSGRSCESASNAAGYKYLLGIVDKRNRLTLAPVETGGVFKLQMKTTHVNETAKGPSSDRARQALLISDFGSRKKQKMEVSRQANIVDVRAVAAASEVGQHLQTAAAQSVSNADNPVATGAGQGTLGSKQNATLLAGRMKTLPPFDASADTPEAAYPLGGIMTAEVFDALEPIARRVVKAMEESTGSGVSQDFEAIVTQLSGESVYVADRLRSLLQLRIQRKGTTAQSDGEIRKSVAKTRAACLVFLAQLLQLHRAPNALHFRLPKPPVSTDGVIIDHAEDPVIPSLAGMPPDIVTILLNRFTEARPSDAAAVHPSYFSRTDELRDRLIAHTAVLSLIIDGYTTDMRLLTSDLRLNLTKVATMFREAGCSVEAVREDSAIVSYIAVLKAPLVFPKLKYSRR